jgi:hypothetical protein
MRRTWCSDLAGVRLDGGDEEPFSRRKEDGEVIEEERDRAPSTVPIARNFVAEVESEVSHLELRRGHHGEKL